MCRNIKTLRPPVTDDVGDEDIRAAALQYVRKVSGFRAPAAHNRLAFDQAVDAVADATRHLLDHLEVRGSASRRRPGEASGASGVPVRTPSRSGRQPAGPARA
ncbi:DUF2277 domain-containing protein [Streptomyces sp. H27-D2]|uniref:DUF2277 domain-containing protein n=1 Tax=Streptomyces sp. H27-D2 TaxID=3046304 RepID=UPI002DBCDA56|nr:DUF2277 domain-containing protein [Streptomyces sp. H27-D2]MEC4019569.1 DUF2277 domain-containing protein [Streptomyces sp. H27-D2]